MPYIEIFKSNKSFCSFYPTCPKFLYAQNEQEQSPHLKRAPFKYPKWKFPFEFKQMILEFLPNYAQNLL